MVALMVSVIEEDKKTYTQVMNQFPQELNVGKLSASTMWELYKTDLQLALEDHAQLKKCKSSDYMNLYFKVKWLRNLLITQPAGSTAPT